MLQNVERMVALVRSEYLAMPGMRLTLTQVQKQFDLDQTVSRVVLEELVDAGVLFLHSDGCYARWAEGAPATDRAATSEMVPPDGRDRV